MKTFNQFKQELPLVEELFLEDLSSEDLYSIISEEDISEELMEAAIITLFARGEIELTEEALMELAALPAPNSGNIDKLRNTMPAPKSTAVGRPLPMQKSLPGGGIKDAVGIKRIYDTPNTVKTLSSPSSTNAVKTVSKASRVGPQAAALGIGLGAGYAAKKALNAVGSGADNNKSTGNIAKANIKSPGSGVKFKGDVPTIPSDNKPKFSDATKGMKLTGKTFDPTKAALSAGFSSSSPEPTKKVIGPMGGAKSDSASSQKPVIAQKSVAKQASAAQKPMQKAPVASKPMQKAPLQKKSLPSTNKPEADPNVGGGFVTAGVSKGPGGNLRTTNVSRGKVDATALPHKNTSLTQPLQKAKNVSYAKPKDWKQSSSSGTTGQKLAPQGSAQRDSQLSKMGYKKF